MLHTRACVYIRTHLSDDDRKNCALCNHRLQCHVSALGMGLCVAFIALVRLPSLKVSTVLLSGLLLYDIFWVGPFPFTLGRTLC